MAEGHNYGEVGPWLRVIIMEERWGHGSGS